MLEDICTHLVQSILGISRGVRVKVKRDLPHACDMRQCIKRIRKARQSHNIRNMAFLDVR